jgi:hypothetical protein
MMPTVRITHLLTMLHRRTDTMDPVTIDPRIMAITCLDIMVTTGEEDRVTTGVMDIRGKESPLVDRVPAFGSQIFATTRFSFACTCSARAANLGFPTTFIVSMGSMADTST